MMQQLQALGIGIIVLAIIVGVGTVLLYRFGGAVASCGNVGASTYAWNSTTDLCQNTSGTQTYTPTSNGWTNTNYLGTQLGTSGLSGWTPAIIALSVGLLFIGAFLFNKGQKGIGRY